MINCIFTKYREILTLMVFLTIILGVVNLNYGLENFSEYAGEITGVVLVSTFGVSFYVYINAALTNINSD